MRPKDVKPEHENHLRRTAYREVKQVGRTRFKIGDEVQISKYKHLFEKKYTPNWTTETFKIVKKLTTNPRTYLLEDNRGQPIKGAFYETELQKTAHPGVFLVERVLKRSGDREYVKWRGFDNSHNSWI